MSIELSPENEQSSMGITHTTVTVGSIGKRAKPWKGLFLVDSGAIASMVPGKVLKKLGVRPVRRDAYEMADGTTIEMDVGGAQITVKGITVISEVIFGPDDAEPLLGALTMQAANLVWDAQREELVVSPRLKPLKRFRAINRLDPLFPIQRNQGIMQEKQPCRFRQGVLATTAVDFETACGYEDGGRGLRTHRKACNGVA